MLRICSVSIPDRYWCYLKPVVDRSGKIGFVVSIPDRYWCYLKPLLTDWFIWSSGVSIPDRYWCYLKHVSAFNKALSVAVSIPDRYWCYLKLGVMGTEYLTAKCVSIPDRYWCYLKRITGIFWPTRIWFQSLIGIDVIWNLQAAISHLFQECFNPW